MALVIQSIFHTQTKNAQPKRKRRRRLALGVILFRRDFTGKVLLSEALTLLILGLNAVIAVMSLRV
jgi:hypothetical protein